MPRPRNGPKRPFDDQREEGQFEGGLGGGKPPRVAAPASRAIPRARRPAEQAQGRHRLPGGRRDLPPHDFTPSLHSLRAPAPAPARFREPGGERRKRRDGRKRAKGREKTSGSEVLKEHRATWYSRPLHSFSCTIHQEPQNQLIPPRMCHRATATVHAIVLVIDAGPGLKAHGTLVWRHVRRSAFAACGRRLKRAAGSATMVCGTGEWS